MKKIRLGHIGTLHDHSSGKLLCALKYPEIFELVGIVEPDPARQAYVRQFGCYQGLNWMTEEELFAAGVDAVMVEGYELDLVRIAQRCIDRGVHVHVDKPAGGSLAEFERLLADAKAKNLIVQLAYMYRYNPAVQDCLQKVKDGTLGEIYEVDAIMDTCHDPDKRAWLAPFPGGIMFYLGCHMVDLVYMMQGAPKRITPYLRCTGFDGVCATDHAMAVLEYDNGISTVRATSTEVNGYGRRQLVVCGRKGTYEIKPLERPIHASISESRYAKTYEDIREILPIETTPGDSRYDEMMLDFARMVRGEKENPFSYEYELELHRLILACCGVNG